MGTYGYYAPEYAMSGKLTIKSDIYSFGVVLLELITGRKAIDMSKKPGEQNLVAWSRPFLKDRKKFVQLVNPLLQGLLQKVSRLVIFVQSVVLVIFRLGRRLLIKLTGRHYLPLGWKNLQ